MCPRDPAASAAVWTAAAALVVEAVGLVVWVVLQLAAAGVDGQAHPSFAWRRLWRWPPQSFWHWYLLGVGACALLALLVLAAVHLLARRQRHADKVHADNPAAAAACLTSRR